jgi:uncharacterized membrane protein YbaN (DUF454 family)
MTNIFLRFSKLFFGWLLIILGIAGLFLPFLQGILFLVLGATILSSESKWVRRGLARLHKRFPRQVARIRALRLKLHRALKRHTTAAY